MLSLSTYQKPQLSSLLISFLQLFPHFFSLFFFFFSVLFSFLFSFPRSSFLFTCSFLSILSPRSTLSSPLLRIGIHIPNPNYRPSHSRFLELLPTSLFSLLFFSSAGLRRFHRVRLVFPAVPSVAPPTAPFHRSITKKKKKERKRKRETTVIAYNSSLVLCCCVDFYSIDLCCKFLSILFIFPFFFLHFIFNHLHWLIHPSEPPQRPSVPSRAVIPRGFHALGPQDIFFSSSSLPYTRPKGASIHSRLRFFPDLFPLLSLTRRGCLVCPAT